MTAAVPTRSTRRRSRPVAALLAGLIGVVAMLAGCTSNDVVAYVDGAPVLTVEQLQRIEQPVIDLLGAGGTRESVITMVILAEATPPIAQAHGIEITDDQEAQVVAIAAEVEDAEARAVVEGYLRSYLVKEMIGQQNPATWGLELGKVDVKVNPRYGSWVPQQGTWVVAPGGSLSAPAPSAEPAGQQGG